MLSDWRGRGEEIERDKEKKKGGGMDGGLVAPIQQTDGSLTPTDLSTGQKREREMEGKD